MCYHAKISRISIVLSLSLFFLFFEFLFFFLTHCFKRGKNEVRIFICLFLTCRNSGDTKLIKGGYLGGVKDKLGECREGVTF